MTPALFVEFGFEALRRPRFGIFVARIIALWTRHSRAATGAAVLALERSTRVRLTHPATILIHSALHSSLFSLRFPQCVSLRDGETRERGPGSMLS
jgi:hypothetical protein